MVRPRICAVVTSADAAAVERAERHADLYELRLDMVGESWPSMIPLLHKPWIATCRLKSEGGSWETGEARRKEEILRALSLGASMVDLDIDTPNLERLAAIIKKKAKLIVSYHNYNETPPPEKLKTIAQHQFRAGADIAKIAAMAGSADDALRLLRIIGEFPGKEVVISAMGETGAFLRILAPLAGSPFTYAATVKGQESAKGQFTASELRKIYATLETT